MNHARVTRTKSVDQKVRAANDLLYRAPWEASSSAGVGGSEGPLFEPARRVTGLPAHPEQRRAVGPQADRLRWGRLFLVTCFGDTKQVTAPARALRAKAVRPHRPAGATSN